MDESIKSEYKARFPIGTDVVYTLAPGAPPVHAHIAGSPTLFHAHIDECVVLMDNGVVVPCKCVREA